MTLINSHRNQEWIFNLSKIIYLLPLILYVSKKKNTSFTEIDKNALSNDKNDSIFNLPLAFEFVYDIRSCMDW
jgi:hypothetical protein